MTQKYLRFLQKLLLEDPETKTVPNLASAMELARPELCNLLQLQKGARQGRAGMQATDEVLSALEALHEAQQINEPRLTGAQQLRAVGPEIAEEASATPEPCDPIDPPEAEHHNAQEDAQATASTSKEGVLEVGAASEMGPMIRVVTWIKDTVSATSQNIVTCDYHACKEYC